MFWSIVLRFGRDGAAGVHESPDAEADVSFGSTYSDWISRGVLRSLLCFWTWIAAGATDLKLFIAMKKTTTSTTSMTTKPKPPPCRLMPGMWGVRRRLATPVKKGREDAPAGPVWHLLG